TADRNLVANFEQNAVTTYTVDVAVLPASSGTAVGGGTFNEGSSVTVTATPAEGFVFVNWTEGGTEVSTNAAYTFTLTANRNLVANFEELPPATFTIKASANPSKGGTTSIGTKTYTEGTAITISANANAGYHFVNWTEDGLEVSTSNNYSFTVTADRTLVANFEQDAAQTYTVALEVNEGEGGTVNFSSQSFEMGASVTAIATPADGYLFTKWMEGSTLISTDSDYTFLVGGDITLTAYFDKKTAVGLTSETNVRVYPNPAVAIITVSGLETGSCVKLIDLAGSTVFEQQTTGNEQNIDVSNLRRGCYFVVVEHNAVIGSRKVILK
ncbi:MAG: T9SS type A sorting domain-containing protein, partial [Prolixibacteraceae bacterium]|nr:T9SS type A sorting domain-containing protein [Prolixibacteraceae bacterium]